MAAPMEPAAAGYSGTPLFRKLGIKEFTHLAVINGPEGYPSWIAPLPPGAVVAEAITKATDLVHVFTTAREELATWLAKLRKELDDDASIWISWPKKASKVPTTITEDVIRELALPLGFVDIKVCAVTPVWSGLKLVVRKEFRK